MNRSKIEALLRGALESLCATGQLPELDLGSLAVEKSRVEGADYSSTLALRLASAIGSPPLAIAELIIAALPEHAMLESAQAAGPGFINFVLDPSWLAGQLGEIHACGKKFGDSDTCAGKSILIEYVSVNPTGPLTVGHGRSAVLGDVLARLLETAGARVTREYYINDAGNQVRLLGLSLQHRIRLLAGKESSEPSAGYRGDYVADWAGELYAEKPELLELEADRQVEFLTAWGISRALVEIRDPLERLGISFDNWFSESRIHDQGSITTTIATLAERGHVVNREQAVWFSHGESGDQANVLIKRTGEPTYLAADIAYHREKLESRRFDVAIDVMGADHHGHTARMRAAMAALGIDPERLKFVLCQIVHLLVDGQRVKQSKRAGEFELLSQLIDDVGADSVRYFMISRDADSQMDFDTDLARRQGDENPVHKVRYAHARIASILRRAGDQGLAPDCRESHRLIELAEINIIKRMLEFPELVALAATNLEPHRIPHYALRLANDFNSMYHRHRVISSDHQLSQARLALAEAVATVLARALDLMGIAAPDRMRRGEP